MTSFIIGCIVVLFIFVFFLAILISSGLDQVQKDLHDLRVKVIEIDTKRDE